MSENIINISKLGYGLMRMPMYGKSKTRLDVLQVKYMTDRFLEAGFSLFESTYAEDDGISEKAVKDALVDRYPRERYLLASKLPVALAADKEKAESMLSLSIERTGAGYFDFYVISGLDKEQAERTEQFGLWQYLSAKKEEGFIRNIGISYKGSAEELDQILTAHPEIGFAELEINYADWYVPETEVKARYDTACSHGLPIIAVSPLKSGLLANPPYEAAGVLRDMNPLSSLASWALRFPASLEGVIVVVADVTNSAQMNDDIETIRAFKQLSEEEQQAIEKAASLIAEVV